MAGKNRPSFLKRQKEQKRAQKAVEKRAAQQARRDRRAAGIEDDSLLEDRALGTDEIPESATSTDVPPAETNE